MWCITITICNVREENLRFIKHEDESLRHTKKKKKRYVRDFIMSVGEKHIEYENTIFMKETKWKHTHYLLC